MPLESPLQGYDRTNNPITAIMATDVHKTDAKRDTKVPAPAPNAGLARKPSDPHPAGRVKHSLVMQVLRGFSFGVYFAACCLAYVLLKDASSTFATALC